MVAGMDDSETGEKINSESRAQLNATSRVQRVLAILGILDLLFFCVQRMGFPRTPNRMTTLLDFELSREQRLRMAAFITLVNCVDLTTLYRYKLVGTIINIVSQAPRLGFEEQEIL